MTKTKDCTETIKSIQNCIGKTVLGVARVQTYLNDQEDEDGVGDLEIKFVDNSFLSLTGKGDAETIKADNKKLTEPKSFNVSETEIISWRRVELNEEESWKKIIGQTLHSVEIELKKYRNIGDQITACSMQFNTDFVTFYETNSDMNKFFVNKALPKVEGQKRIEIIK